MQAVWVLNPGTEPIPASAGCQLRNVKSRGYQKLLGVPHPLRKSSDKGNSKELARNSAYSWEHPGSARQDGSWSRERPGCHLIEARNIFEGRIF